MKDSDLISWLLQGDYSIQYQVYRDLLNEERPDLQENIALRGWGKQYLDGQRTDGHWGLKFYQPKWTSTHYTLLDLRNLCISRDHKGIQKIIKKLVDTEKGADGGINPSAGTKNSDLCINGMFLHYACYFKVEAEGLDSIVDLILDNHMKDGGFNCQLNRSGARHSSLHTTISTLEGIASFKKYGYNYRFIELKEVEKAAIEFMLIHQLYLSDRTGKVINPKFLRFPYPSRWYYDILRALDYFQYNNLKWDDRLSAAITQLMKKRNKDGTWNVNAKHPGEVHFEMEKAGKPSRWNTLRALRVLKHFKNISQVNTQKLSENPFY